MNVSLCSIAVGEKVSTAKHIVVAARNVTPVARGLGCREIYILVLLILCFGLLIARLMASIACFVLLIARLMALIVYVVLLIACLELLITCLELLIT